MMFQENLVVWKCDNSARLEHIFEEVSGELSSMEIPHKRSSRKNRRFVSGELSSMEI